MDVSKLLIGLHQKAANLPQVGEVTFTMFHDSILQVGATPSQSAVPADSTLGEDVAQPDMRDGEDDDGLSKLVWTRHGFARACRPQPNGGGYK